MSTAIPLATVTRSKEEILTKVRTMLDEILTNESEFDSGVDETQLETIITDKALEALRFVNGNADPSLLVADETLYNTGGYYEEKTTIVSGYTVGVFYLKQGFLRLLQAGYDEWPYYLDDSILSTEKDWAKLVNKYTTGTVERPALGMKVVPGTGSTGERQLYLFSKGTSASARCSYMVFPAWSEDSLTISEMAEDGFFYYLTGLVLTVLGDERQQSMYDQAALLLGIHKNTTEGQQ